MPNLRRRLQSFRPRLLDDAYLTTSYEQIRGQLLRVLEEQMTPEPRMLVEHYLAVLNAKLDQNSKSVRLAHEISRRFPKAVEVAQSIVEPGRGEPRLTPQARQIYDANRTAFDHILKHRPNRSTEVTAILKAMMEEQGREWGWKPAKSEPRIIRFVPREWLKLAGEGKDLIPPLFCAIHLAEDLPRLRFVASPSAPQEWKEKLAHRCREWDLPGAMSEGRKQGGIYAFYIEPLSDVRETASSEEAASRIWNETISAMSRPEMREMIADVARVLVEG